MLASKSPTVNYSMLECLGISTWVRRSSLFEFKQPLWGARLVVILSEEIEPEEIEANKVLTGMLNVLNLNSSAYWLGWIKKNIDKIDIGKKDITTKLIDEIKVWSPKNVLLLGQRFEEMEKIKNEIKEAQLFISHHPKELVIHPHYKKAAYQELLRLKERLH
jgi:hypothetical protein